MLSLQMKSGDYFTIGEDVVVQVFKESGSRFRVSVDAPREVPILRGDVRERSGESRPDNLRSSLRLSPSAQRHAARHQADRAQRAAERRAAQEERSRAVQAMRAIAEHGDLPPAVREGLCQELARLEEAEQALLPK